MEVPCLSNPLDANEEDWMVKGISTLFLCGRVTYRDAFDHPRYIEFCEGVVLHRMGLLGASDVDTYPAERHNKAD
jgi:hypothetical protein